MWELFALQMSENHPSDCVRAIANLNQTIIKPGLKWPAFVLSMYKLVDLEQIIDIVYTGLIMDYEWDEKKDRSNDQKHGIRFDEAKGVFADPNAKDFADDYNPDEERFIRIGLTVRGLLVVVYSEPDPEVTRIISARKATKSEREFYEK